MDNDLRHKFLLAIGDALLPDDIWSLYELFKLKDTLGGGLPNSARIVRLSAEAGNSGISDVDFFRALLGRVHQILWERNPREADRFHLSNAAAFQALNEDGVPLDWTMMPDTTPHERFLREIARLPTGLLVGLRRALTENPDEVHVAAMFRHFGLIGKDPGAVVSASSRYQRLRKALAEAKGDVDRADLEYLAAVWTELVLHDEDAVCGFVAHHTDLAVDLQEHSFPLPELALTLLQDPQRLQRIRQGVGEEQPKELPPQVGQHKTGAKKKADYGGKWKVIRELSAGGQGKPKVVKRHGDRRQFVLKELHDPRDIARLRKEVAAYQRLDHPNIARVVDASLEEKPFYIVLPFYERESLDKGYLQLAAVDERLRHFRQICAAVAHAHTLGIIHRDIKPGNVFFDGKDVYVGDFGLAYIDTDEARPTETLEVVGARHFMPPEAEYGRLEDIQPSFDVYSLGKLLHRMLACRSFPRERAHLDGGPYDLRLHGGPEIHLLYELFERTIQEEPRDRYTDAGELQEAFEATARRIGMKAHVLDLRVRQHCNFCGVGEYRPVKLKPAHSMIGPPGGHPQLSTNVLGLGDTLVLQCGHCGNLQVFRLDGVDGKWTGLETV